MARGFTIRFGVQDAGEITEERVNAEVTASQAWLSATEAGVFIPGLTSAAKAVAGLFSEGPFQVVISGVDNLSLPGETTYAFVEVTCSPRGLYPRLPEPAAAPEMEVVVPDALPEDSDPAPVTDVTTSETPDEGAETSEVE